MDSEEFSKTEKWLDEVHTLKQAKSPFFYSSNRLGSPKYENGILEMCYAKGMTPLEALKWWKKQ